MLSSDPKVPGIWLALENVESRSRHYANDLYANEYFSGVDLSKFAELIYSLKYHN